MTIFAIAPLPANARRGTIGLILAFFAVVFFLEMITPSDYVFGYLYIGGILFANAQLGRKATLQATIAAVVLTLLNLWIPDSSKVEASTIADRIIAAFALGTTGFLSERNRRYQEAFTQQQTKLESQEQLSRIREDFASTLTHDLRTPLLGAIETIAAFQQEKFGAVSSTQQQVLATMKRSHLNSLQLVETLLDVYRNDTEGLQLQFMPIDLTVLAEEAASTLNELAATRRVHLSISQDDSDFRKALWVQGDPFQLHRVFSNLLINAINHTRRGGRVEVVLDSQASSQVVKVFDTGAGIKPEEFPHLFDRFYQGESDRQAKGSGLGLYLSRQIIEAHGGIIWAENQTNGGTGAIFGFRLPVYPYQSAA
jgi:two-component system, NarL family, sensor kinase